MADIRTKPVDDVDKADIDELVTNAVPEGRRLEYKEALPGNSDADKREFAADVSSFANSGGGILLYGMREQRTGSGPTGVPEAAQGLANINADQQMQRLEGVANSGIDPRIPGLRLRVISGFPDGPVLIVHVPRSWRGPHMVTLNHGSRFFARNSSGKYQLDVDEIRHAFRTSESVPGQVHRLRDDRLAKISGGDTPVPFAADSILLILHCVPITALDGQAQVDIRQLEPRWRELSLYGDAPPNYLINFDGLVTHNASPDKPARSYAQMDRTGVIEAVVNAAGVTTGDKIFGETIERACVAEVANHLTLYRALNIEPPIVVMLTLMNVEGQFVALRNEMMHFLRGRTQKIDRPVLRLPDALFDNFTADPGIVLRRSFDAFWQAAGWTCSPSYDENGRRK